MKNKLKKLIFFSLTAVFLGCFGSPAHARCVLPGDIDANGVVEFADYLLIAVNFGKMISEVDFPTRLNDYSGDGVIGFAEFLIVSANFGKSWDVCG